MMTITEKLKLIEIYVENEATPQLEPANPGEHTCSECFFFRGDTIGRCDIFSHLVYGEGDMFPNGCNSVWYGDDYTCKLQIPR